MRVKGTRGLALGMVALLALSGLKVSTEEPIQAEEIMAETTAVVFGSDAEVEIVESVSNGGMEESKRETEIEVLGEDVETPRQPPGSWEPLPLRSRESSGDGR